ncbi:chemotaxis protein CheB [Sphingobacterium wenxiniae]|uniref:protein-glutamate methylesterase n=1 Tax=Sphingobacterium wenxiniae TaxID=683125 RepID=A0A1I6Q8H1_9SPHI|nr:chemotaxis protein CheB [Sphingobacterium wenxiniae]SFS48747.1 CheB methylesterase [Sphingobacterium wenxiniae]
MATDILLIGGSAGSITVLLQVLPAIDTDISFPIVIVLHRKSYPKSELDHLLEISTALPVQEVDDKMELENGKIYLVPADYHLLFEDERSIALDVSEKVNYSRPSIDVTFLSAASIFGDRTVALLLSGGNKDGVEGLVSIVEHQGRVLIQDPVTAEVDYMPQQAMEALPTATILRPEHMADAINQLKHYK